MYPLILPSIFEAPIASDAFELVLPFVLGLKFDSSTILKNISKHCKIASIVCFLVIWLNFFLFVQCLVNNRKKNPRPPKQTKIFVKRNQRKIIIDTIHSKWTLKIIRNRRSSPLELIVKQKTRNDQHICVFCLIILFCFFFRFNCFLSLACESTKLYNT